MVFNDCARYSQLLWLEGRRSVWHLSKPRGRLIPSGRMIENGACASGWSCTFISLNISGTCHEMQYELTKCSEVSLSAFGGAT